MAEMTEEQQQQTRISTLEDRNQLRFHRKVQFGRKAAFYTTLGMVQMVAAVMLYPGNHAAIHIGGLPIIFGMLCLLLSGYYDWRMTETVDLRKKEVDE